ncbi:lipase secretion chaperone [Aurantivibrio plasticivorans]
MKYSATKSALLGLSFGAALTASTAVSYFIQRPPTDPIASYTFSDIAPTGKASTVEFDEIEDAIRHIEYDPNNPSEYGQALEAALRQATESYTQALTTEELTRITFLSSKVLSPEVTKVFSQALPLFTTYHIEEKALLNASQGTKTITEELIQFEKLRELRRSHLGESLSRLLYEKQHLFTLNLLQRRAVQEDNSLSDEEKQQQLQVLQEALRDAMSPSP